MTTSRSTAHNGPSVAEIRAEFLDFFRQRGHATPASAPLVPQSDPTLMFTNAGMVPFKNMFTGLETPPSPRAATSQKCVRAGGKHNDLDNVGYTARHHTFFEMLGNFSFGDYFKEGAIEHAWQLITRGYGLAPERLLVTVYHTDDEAAALWRKIAGLPDERIIRIATSDNFWSMGDTGPCGPCTEIFYDHGPALAGGPPGSPDEDGDRFIEIWNLVFMQFDQAADGTRVPLPKPSIDTGMGLERIAAILQGVHSNYDIDVFRALIGASEALTGVKADGEQAASHRVIADHLRASSFLIADGVLPSNEGRGSVLRRIMRRAMRHAHGLGAREPLMHRLAPSLADAMGDAYPELRRAQPLIQSTLEQEEERFRRTLSRGLDLLADATSQMRAGDSLSGETAFTLYDTYGFPVDLTADILRARGITVDQEGFETAMERQREQGRESWAGSGEAASGAVWLRLKDTHGATDFLGYGAEYGEARLIAIVQNGETVDRLSAGAEAELVFDRTPFYAESGGQAGDHGAIRFAHGAAFTVRDTRKQAGALHGHLGTLDAGKIAVGDMATLDIDAGRRARIRANHSATHLLHAALRNVLGPGVTQKGSLVEADRLRFDFSHGQPMTPEAIERVEAEVNAVIRQNAEARIIETSPEEAIAAGAMALFGEKYGERVRVLTLGSGLEDSAKPYSVELCGGTHVARTGDIALFAILSESGVAAGIRRIEATTGAAALAFLKGQAHVARALSEQLRTPIPALAERVAQIADERRRFERDLADARTRLAMAGPATGAASGPETVAGVHFLSRVLSDVPAKDLRRLIDEGKVQVGSGVVVYVTADGGKAAIAVGVTDDLVGRLSAVDLVKAGVAALGGQGGGGRADLAQGGGPDAGACEAAVAAVRAALAG